MHLLTQENYPASDDEELFRGRGRPIGARTLVKSVNLRKVAEIDQKRTNHLHCNVCSTPFTSLVNFANHCIKNHFNTVFYQFDCGFCYEIHTSKESFLKHLLCQAGEVKTEDRVSIVCPLCVLPQGSYTSEHEFCKHLSQHVDSQENSIFCMLPACDYLAYNIEDLTTHIITLHTNQIVPNSVCPLCKNPKSSTGYWGGPTVEPELLNSYIEEVDGAEDTCPLCNTVLKDLNTVLVNGNEVISFEKPKYYRCSICNSGFSTQTKVTKHACRQLHTTVCSQCNRHFTSKKRLVFHLQSHIDPSMTLRCDVCMLSFTDETTCYDHVRFNHESETLCCDTCGKTYITRIGLSMHQMYHDDVRKFKCPECGKRFLNQATLKEHRVSHLNVKPFQCDICGKSLSRASRLRIHLKVHSARNNTNFQKCYTCKICGFVTFSGDRLTEHNVKTHNANDNDFKTSILHKLYRCEYCDNCYEMPALLHQHRETHFPETTENPFICGLCNGFFKTYSRLVTHKLSHGINTETHILQISSSLENSDGYIIPQYFCCKYCDKLYEQYTAYNIHMKHSKHFVPKDKYDLRDTTNVSRVQNRKPRAEKRSGGAEKKRRQREIDFAVKSLKENMPPPIVNERPVRIGPIDLDKLICCKCGKNFPSERQLRVHENRHNPRRKRKSYSCEDCPRWFTSKTDLKRHENGHHKTRLVCENCGKEFRYKGWYNSHVDNKVCYREGEVHEEEELPDELLEDLEDPRHLDLIDPLESPSPFSDIINRILLY